MGLLSKRRTVHAEAPSSSSRALRIPYFALTHPAPSLNLENVTSWPNMGTARAAALSIPAVRSCRNLIVGAAVQMAIYRYRGVERVDSGMLITQPDPDTTWARTLAGTLEDLIYDGVAYWIVLATDGVATVRNPDGLPVRARWVPSCDVSPRVSLDAGSYSRLEGYEIAGVRGLVDPHNVIRFDSPIPGVLIDGANAIANALALEDKARQLSTVDIPAGTLTNRGAELSVTEAEDLVDRFEEQRRARTVAFLQDVEYAREELSAEDLQLVEARANAATEMARLHNMPVTMVSASPSGGASAMLYANLGSQLSLMVSSAVAPYLTCIEQTLSLPTVTPQGQAVAFDQPAFLRSDPAELKDYVLELVAAKVITVDEGRQMLGIGTGTASLQPGTV